MVVARMRIYRSRSHLRAVAHSLNLAADIERAALAGELDADAWSPYQPRAMSAILLSVSFVKATVNKLYQDAADDETAPPDDLDAELQKRLAEECHVWKVSDVRQATKSRRL